MEKQIGGSLGAGSLLGRQNGINGPTWSQKDTQRKPKADKVGPKTPTLIFVLEKMCQQSTKQKRKKCAEKVGARMNRNSGDSAFSSFVLALGSLLEAKNV